MKQTFLPGLLRRILLAWLIAVTAEYLLLPRELQNLSSLEGLKQMSLQRMTLFFFAGMLILLLISRKADRTEAERWGLVAVFLILAAVTLSRSFSLSYLLFCGLLLLIFTVYAGYGWNREALPVKREKQAGRVYLWITAAASGIFFCLVSAWTLGRVWSFSTPTYDFGIFSQMFYSMKETGLPMTTLERDGLLSHFHVHMSPVYYLLLPLYFLAPYPATLQVLQAAVITSAVIPLWKIGKCHGLTCGQSCLLCLLLLLYPAFAGGVGYDIHENCFLTPLLLWLLYGIDSKRIWLMSLSAALTLTVKEDAAVYVAIIALWMIVKALPGNHGENRTERIAGTVMLLASMAWFFAVTGYLANYGDGVMTYRYSNFMFDGGNSLLTVVKAAVLNPMKVIYECADQEKLSYIALTMLPLLGLPLFTRRYERYILLIPYVLVNLMPDYQYQHHIFFQYNFGSVGCLLYLTAVNLADIRKKQLRLLPMVCAAVISAVCVGRLILPEAVAYPVQSVRYYGYYQQLRDTLSQIPEDASVAATTFYTTVLSQREVLYDVRYASREHILSADYIVLHVTSEGDYEKFAADGRKGYDVLTELLLQNGYTVFSEIPDTLTVYYWPADKRIPGS